MQTSATMHDAILEFTLATESQSSRTFGRTGFGFRTFRAFWQNYVINQANPDPRNTCKTSPCAKLDHAHAALFTPSLDHPSLLCQHALFYLANDIEDDIMLHNICN